MRSQAVLFKFEGHTRTTDQTRWQAHRNQPVHTNTKSSFKTRAANTAVAGGIYLEEKTFNGGFKMWLTNRI